jgi:exosortase family protein XrtF
MVISTYISKWNKVPADVRRFILRALAILISWKILYLVFLLPTRVLDKPLSHSVANGTAWLLNKYTNSTAYYAKSETGTIITDNGPVISPLEDVYFNQRNVVSIEDPCNALELFVLYAGFIICMPASLWRKIFFIVGGILLIHIINVIRCAVVAYTIIYNPKYADFAHHYVFTFIVYALIIVLWLIFVKKLKIAHAETEQ